MLLEINFCKLILKWKKTEADGEQLVSFGNSTELVIRTVPKSAL